MKVLESPFIPSHLTFKSFEFTHFQSINQTINHNYLFIITFQNLDLLRCYKPTTLEMNLILEIRRGQKEIGQARGSSQNPSIVTGGLGCYHPQKHHYVSTKNSYTPSLLLKVLIFSDLQNNSFSGLLRQWHNLFLNNSVLSSWYGFSVSGSSQLSGLAPILSNYRYLMVVINLGFLLQEMSLGFILTV